MGVRTLFFGNFNGLPEAFFGGNVGCSKSLASTKLLKRGGGGEGSFGRRAGDGDGDWGGGGGGSGVEGLEAEEGGAEAEGGPGEGTQGGLEHGGRFKGRRKVVGRTGGGEKCCRRAVTNVSATAASWIL